MRGFDFLLAACLTLLVLNGATGRSAEAMTFSTATRSDGLRIVLAEGPVVDGDADRLRVALQAADRDAAGFKVMALDSLGGSVLAAFAMVEVMDREKVATVVRPGETCASACGQVLFLSGGHRTIEGDGRLGLHSCHMSGDRTRSVMCNELIAQNAMARGTPYGSIMVFLHLNGPAQMKWIGSEEASFLGFIRKPPAVNPTRDLQVRPSF